jgi:tRNA(Ile)-lysidine synthase
MELTRDREFLKLVVNTGGSDVFHILHKDDMKATGISFNHFLFRMQPFKRPDFKHSLYLDRDEMAWPLYLRLWKKGDRFQPFGMNGHQSAADHLTNRKVSAAGKSKALILEDSDETICAVLFPSDEDRPPPGTISEKVRCDESTTQCLMITAKS